MVQSGKWIPGRSEAYIQQIGNTDQVITTAGALHDEERKLWKDYEKGVEDDLLQVAVILNTIDQQVGILKGLLAEAQQRNVKVAAESALGTITLAIGQIPEKWKVGDHTGFGKLKDAITNYLRLNPWEKGQTDIEIASFGEQIIEQAKVELGAKKPSKKLKKLQTDKKKLQEKRDKFDSQWLLVETALDSQPTIVEKIKEKIRASAAEQYARGATAHVSQKSSMKTKKQYLGEIATTGELRTKGEKGRGILWASPWSPGVNTAFLEGGVSTGNVFKLKTAIPKDLEALLKEGKIDEFKAAVKGHTEKEYYPFWNSLEKPGRFTIYTDELAYLIGKGYRLHEFKRKSGEPQQLMVAPGQLSEVESAYKGR